MEWIDLQSIIVVAQKRSISKAAQSLHVTQPTLTSRIKKIEEEIGIQLFERSWRGVEPTDQGKVFLSHAKKALNELDTAIKNLTESTSIFESVQINDNDPDHTLNSAQQKNLKIGISSPLVSIFLKHITFALTKEFHSLLLHVIATDSKTINELVSIGELQFGFVTRYNIQPEIQAIPLIHDEMVLVGPKHDIFLTDEMNTGENYKKLLNRPFVFFQNATALRQEEEALSMELFGSVPQFVHEVDSHELLMEFLNSGFGYSILPLTYFVHDLDKLHNVHRNGYLQQLSKKLPFNVYRIESLLSERTIYLIYVPKYIQKYPQYEKIFRYFADFLAVKTEI